MLLFVLNQKEPLLAAAEAKAAAHGWGWWTRPERAIDGTLLLATRRNPAHLALTRHVTRVHASCPRKQLATTLERMNWTPQGSWRVTLTKMAPGAEEERTIANVLWNNMQQRGRKTSPVNLRNPDTTVDIVLTSTHAYIGARVWECTEQFSARRAHLRPALHPSSLDPALARAIVNIACVTHAHRLHDAFCGSGGILIEAGLAHIDVSGADIDAAMIARARKNCAALRLQPDLRVADATQWLPRAQAIVGDLPYGRNTTPVALQPLLEAFLIRAAHTTRRVIIGLPHKLTSNHVPKPWAVRAEFESYVHKSMTKRFYVLERVS